MSEVRDSDPSLELVCRKCSSRFGIELLSHRTTCPVCGGLLDVVGKRVWSPKGRGLIRYAGMLPLGRNLSRILATVGDTPAEEAEIRGKRIIFKHEHLNPSGSFKDRGTAIAISLALEHRNVAEFAEDSSGNTAIAVSMIARKVRVRASIFVPRDAPSGKLRLLRLLRSKIVTCESRAKATEKVAEYVAGRSDVYYVDHLRNPAYIEGARSIAYEVFEQFGEVGSVVVPIGSGGLMLGVISGWLDLLNLGLVRKVPKVLGVQGVEVAPIYRALYGDRGVVIEGRSRLADGIRVPNPPRAEQLVELLRRVRGDVVLVNDVDIAKALRELIDMGIVVEPTSATVLAALDKARSQGVDLPEPILLVLTGSGMKLIDEVAEIIGA